MNENIVIVFSAIGILQGRLLDLARERRIHGAKTVMYWKEKFTLRLIFIGYKNSKRIEIDYDYSTFDFREDSPESSIINSFSCFEAKM